MIDLDAIRRCAYTEGGFNITISTLDLREILDLARTAADSLPRIKEGASASAAPVSDDLMDVVRTLCAIAARMRELPDEKRHLYPSPTAEGSPVLAAARAACVARGYTADGLAVEGVEYPATAPVADAVPTADNNEPK